MRQERAARASSLVGPAAALQDPFIHSPPVSQRLAGACCAFPVLAKRELTSCDRAPCRQRGADRRSSARMLLSGYRLHAVGSSRPAPAPQRRGGHCAAVTCSARAGAGGGLWRGAPLRLDSVAGAGDSSRPATWACTGGGARHAAVAAAAAQGGASGSPQPPLGAPVLQLVCPGLGGCSCGAAASPVLSGYCRTHFDQLLQGLRQQRDEAEEYARVQGARCCPGIESACGNKPIGVHGYCGTHFNVLHRRRTLAAQAPPGAVELHPVGTRQVRTKRSRQRASMLERDGCCCGCNPCECSVDHIVELVQVIKAVRKVRLTKVGMMQQPCVICSAGDHGMHVW